jgi:glutamine amidotransferase
MVEVFKFIATLAERCVKKACSTCCCRRALRDGVLLDESVLDHAGAPFGVATLLDQDVEIDFQRETTPNDVVTVIATQPLTGNETWHKIMPGEWALFCLGDRVV